MRPLRTALIGTLAILALAVPGAQADIRRQGAEVETVHYEGIVANIYSDRSLWLLLPQRGESLYLSPDGSAVHFDDVGNPLEKGRWDPAETGDLRGLRELSGPLKTQVDRTLAYLRRRPARKAGAPPPPPGTVERSTEIEWVGP